MALKKPTPAFENEPDAGGDTAVLDRPQETAQAPAAAAVTVADENVVVETSRAIAKASNTAVATENSAASEAKKFQKEFDAMKDASDFTYGNYAVFKGNNGEISESGGDKASLGRWAKVRLMSWGMHYEVSPGESGASTKDFVGYSKDGVTIDSVIGEEQKPWVGKAVAEYLAHLRTTEGFTEAKTRRFIDTACALMATDSGEGPLNKVVQITLSESSISSFSKYQQELVDTARCVAMGLPLFAMPEDPFTFYFIREVATKGSNKWTKLKISSTLPNKL